MSLGAGLVSGLLDAAGLPSKRIAKGAAALLVLGLLLFPGTVRDGIDAWSTARAEQATEIAQHMIDRLTPSLVPPTPQQTPGHHPAKK